MKSKWTLAAGIALVILGLLWASGSLEGPLLTLAGLVGAGAGVAAKKYSEAKRDTDILLEEVEDVLGDIGRKRHEHGEEVERIEKEDYNDTPIGDLIDGANERERRRTRTTIR